MGLGSLGGNYRNAGFWKGTPIVEWRYGQFPKMLTKKMFEDDKIALPHEFSESLAEKFHIHRIFVGHFTEQGRLVPEMFKFQKRDVVWINVDTTFGRPYRVFPAAKPYSTQKIKGQGAYADYVTKLSKDGEASIKGSIQVPGPDDSTVDFEYQETSHELTKDPMGHSDIGHAEQVDYDAILSNKWQLLIGPAVAPDKDAKVSESGGPAEVPFFINEKKEQKDLQAYEVAVSRTKEKSKLIKVNHRMTGNAPPGVTWYFFTKASSAASGQAQASIVVLLGVVLSSCMLAQLI
jgi:hypothetical protein